MLKAYFSRQIEIPEKTLNCPPVETLGKYVLGALKPNELYGVSGHVKSCKFCNELIEGALLYSAYGKHIGLETVPDKIKNRAKSLHPSYKIKGYNIMGYFKKNIWLIFSLISFAVSFFMPRHFLQFVILTAIFGLKWVFDRESTRTLIMIYNAWKRHDRESEKEIERIFKSRI